MNTMIDTVFGDVTFDFGWSKKDTLSLFGKQYNILVTANAYFANEAITQQQQKAYSAFTQGKTEISKKIEQLLSAYTPDSEKNLTPRYIIFEKNGAYALMLDDKDDPDDGIAVQLAPIEQVMSQDAYL